MEMHRTAPQIPGSSQGEWSSLSRFLHRLLSSWPCFKIRNYIKYSAKGDWERILWATSAHIPSLMRRQLDTIIYCKEEWPMLRDFCGVKISWFHWQSSWDNQCLSLYHRAFGKATDTVIEGTQFILTSLQTAWHWLFLKIIESFGLERSLRSPSPAINIMLPSPWLNHVLKVTTAFHTIMCLLEQKYIFPMPSDGSLDNSANLPQ